MGRLKPPRSVIGLDIGRATVKAAQVTHHDKGARLDGCVALKRTAAAHSLEPAEAERLLRATERRGLTATSLVLTAPNDALVGGSLNVPPADSSASRDKIISMELSRAHKLPSSSFEMVWWELPARSSGARIGQVHALGLPHAAVEDSLQVLSELGLGIVRTVPSSLALLAAAQRQPVDPRSISAVIDLASNSGHLSLIYAGRVVHERALPDFNLHKLTQEASELIGVDRAVATHALGLYGVSETPEGMVACETNALLGDVIDSLAEEIGMSFAYVSHLYPEAELGQLLLSGGGANIPGLSESLSTILELETALITPNRLLQGCEFGSECNDPALTQAVGAAVYGESA
ncbi:MAG: pilus assembly protein PilM [Planctomycetota bacterium]